MNSKIKEIVDKYPFVIDCNGNLEEDQFEIFISAIQYFPNIYKTYKKQVQLFVDLFVEYIQPMYNPSFQNTEMSFFETLAVYSILILKGKTEEVKNLIKTGKTDLDIQSIVEQSINYMKECDSFKLVKFN